MALDRTWHEKHLQLAAAYSVAAVQARDAWAALCVHWAAEEVGSDVSPEIGRLHASQSRGADHFYETARQLAREEGIPC